MPASSANSAIRTPLLVMGLLEIGALFGSVYIAAVFIYGSLENCEALLGPLWLPGTAVAGVLFGGLVAVGLYQFHQRVNFREAFIRVAVGIFAAGLVLAALFFLLPAFALPPVMIAAASLIALSLISILRFGFVRSVDENIFRRRILIYGAGERASAISDLKRRADRRGFKIVGRIRAPGDTQELDVPRLIKGDDPLFELAKRKGAEEIVVAMDDRRGNLPIRELLDCRLHGIDVIDLVEFLERETGMIRIDLVNPGWLIFSPGFRIGPYRRFLKRTMDLVVAGLVLLFGWPVMLLVALAIKIEDGFGAPVIYRQRRVGLHNETFEVLKFRSMIVDAEKDGGAVWAAENDNRITKVGAFIRKTRLDELPQVFNVLKGEMSIVGPRPERPEFVAELSESIPYYSERHFVKPGVTGWAQLRYSYASSQEDTARKLQFDLYYVKNQDLLLDLLILLQTVEVVLWGKGAR